MRWPWQTTARSQLPDDGRAYFRLKRREYESLVLAQPTCASPVLTQIFAKDEVDLSWDDVFSLDDVLINIKPIQDIRRERWWWLERYQSLAQKEEFDAYVASNPPNATDPDGDKVRADVKQVAASVHYILT